MRTYPKRFKLTEDDLKKMETMAGIGLPLEKIAHIFGVSIDTFRTAMKRYGDAAFQAVERGSALGDQSVHRTAYQMATSGNHPALTIYWLKCRSKWSHAPETVVNNFNVQQTAINRVEKLVSEEDRTKLLDIVLKLKAEPGDAPCKLIQNSSEQSARQVVSLPPPSDTES